MVAGHFLAAGFSNVLVVEGGTRAWIDAGLPVVTGKRRAISIERQVRIGAGSLVLLGAILGAVANPLFFVLSAFVGAGLIFAGITDWCGMGLLLARASTFIPGQGSDLISSSIPAQAWSSAKPASSETA